MCWTYRRFRTCYRCKIWAPLENSSPHWCPNLVTRLMKRRNIHGISGNSSTWWGPSRKSRSPIFNQFTVSTFYEFLQTLSSCSHWMTSWSHACRKQDRRFFFYKELLGTTTGQLRWNAFAWTLHLIAQLKLFNSSRMYQSAMFMLTVFL